MGDRVWVQLPVQNLSLFSTTNPDQLNLAIPPWVGAISTGYGRLPLGSKGRYRMARVWWQGKLSFLVKHISYVSVLVRALIRAIQVHFTLFYGGRSGDKE